MPRRSIAGPAGRMPPRKQRDSSLTYESQSGNLFAASQLRRSGNTERMPPVQTTPERPLLQEMEPRRSGNTGRMPPVQTNLARPLAQQIVERSQQPSLENNDYNLESLERDAPLLQVPQRAEGSRSQPNPAGESKNGAKHFVDKFFSTCFKGMFNRIS
jgi:hypothetical protein